MFWWRRSRCQRRVCGRVHWCEEFLAIAVDTATSDIKQRFAQLVWLPKAIAVESHQWKQLPLSLSLCVAALVSPSIFSPPMFNWVNLHSTRNVIANIVETHAVGYQNDITSWLFIVGQLVIHFCCSESIIQCVFAIFII